MGEDRTDGKKIRYFYDAQGICGFGYTKDGKTKYYKYVKDLFGNVIMLMTASGEPLVKYEYDTFGTPTAYVCVAKRWFGKNANVTFESAEVRKELWDEPWEIAEINPYRWKSFYYDTESGYYYVSGRYYSPEAGIYLDVEDPEEITENAGITGGLDRNAITLDNYFEIEANSFDIFTQDKLTPDITYDPNENISWWERNWLSVLLIGIQLIVGILLCFIPCAQGVGIQMIIGAVMGAISLAVAEANPGAGKVLGGLGTISVGASAISTGISMFGCGPVGWILGVISIGVGVATVAIGANEVVNGVTGVNYLREWTGMSQETYDALYLGLNIASTVCTIAGQAVRHFKGCRCFIAGTLVLTAEGYKKIEDIQVGDMVLAYDEQTGEQCYKPVLQLFRNESKDWTSVTVSGGEEIISTPGHKYYLPATKQWVAAEDLKKGTKVLLSDGSYGIVEAVKPIHYDKPQTTYNFEVADVHTYYVGNGVLVHNMNGQPCGKITNKEATKVAKDLGYEPTNYTSKNGAKIFTNGKNYISADVTSHNGGFWKMADSVKEINSKTTRLGTYDKWLKIRIGD